MSVITYLASDQPLQQVDNPVSHHLIIDTEAGTAVLEAADDDRDFGIYPLSENAWDIYTDKPYRAEIQWDCTPGRAAKVLDYIRKHLETAREVELWHGWQGGDLPRIQHYEAHLADFTPEDIVEIHSLPVCTEMPVHHCVVIHRTK